MFVTEIKNRDRLLLSGLLFLAIGPENLLSLPPAQSLSTLPEHMWQPSSTGNQGYPAARDGVQTNHNKYSEISYLPNCYLNPVSGPAMVTVVN